MRARTYILLLLLTGFLVYFSSVTNHFIGDDVDQIVRNPAVHSLKNIPTLFAGSTYSSGGREGGLVGLYYRPLMLTVYTVIYSIFGSDALFFHLVQILFHICVVVALFYFFRKFVKESIAFIGSLFFLVHPINTEAVVYIADLQDILFVLFGLLCLVTLTKSALRNRKYYLVLGLQFLIALFSKETAVLFLPIILLYGWLIEKLNKKTIINIGITLSSALGIYLIFRFGIAQMYSSQVTVAPISHAPFLQRVIHIPAIIYYYLRTTLYPKDLITSQFWFIKQINWQNFYQPLILDLLAGAVLFYLGLKLREKSTKFTQYIFFSSWFIIGLGFHLQIFPLDMTVAERWFYFPFIGLIGMIALTADQLSWKQKWHTYIAIGVVTILVVLLSIRTVDRSQDWKDTITLYSHDVKLSQDNFILENSLGTEYILDGKYQQAKPYIIASVKEYPFYANLNNLAIIQVEEGDIAGAKESLQIAIQSGSNFYVYENMANFLLVYDKPEAAKQFSIQALQVYPKNARLWIALAQAEYFLGNKEKAILAGKKALKYGQSKSIAEIYIKIQRGLPIIQLKKK